MIALAVNLSAFGLIAAAVIWTAFSLWENWRREKRRDGYWHDAYMEQLDENTRLRIERHHADDVIDAAEEWRDDPETGIDELIEAVDRHRKWCSELPPPTGEPIT